MTDAIETNPTPSPFDNLAALRLDQSYADTVGVKKLLTTVPVRKPNRQDFVRVHPGPAVASNTAEPETEIHHRNTGEDHAS
jgi:hypothetical protein